MSPELEGRFLATGSSGKSLTYVFNRSPWLAEKNGSREQRQEGGVEQAASVEEERWSDLRYNLQDRQTGIADREEGSKKAV